MKLEKIIVEKIFGLLIRYYKGDISKMKLAGELGLSFSQTKIYVEEIEKIIIKNELRKDWSD